MIRVLAILVLLCVPALAHDPDTGEPNWITDDKYKGSDNVGCCGPKDCDRVDPARIKATQSGLWLMDFNELVPWSEATPSQDRHYWRCHRWDEARSRRCFFAPVGQY